MKTSKSAQFLASFASVKEVYESGWTPHGGFRCVALVVPAVSDGRRKRYHVYRLDLDRQTLAMIGNELRLPLARAVARRLKRFDGTPLTPRDLIVGRLPRDVWEKRFQTTEIFK